MHTASADFAISADTLATLHDAMVHTLDCGIVEAKDKWSNVDTVLAYVAARCCWLASARTEALSAQVLEERLVLRCRRLLHHAWLGEIDVLPQHPKDPSLKVIRVGKRVGFTWGMVRANAASSLPEVLEARELLQALEKNLPTLDTQRVRTWCQQCILQMSLMASALERDARKSRKKRQKR